MSDIPKLEAQTATTLFINAAWREDAHGRPQSGQFIRNFIATAQSAQNDGTTAFIVAIVEALLERERRLIEVVNMLTTSLDVDLETISPEIIENVGTLLIKKYIDRMASPKPTTEGDTPP